MEKVKYSMGYVDVLELLLFNNSEFFRYTQVDYSSTIQGYLSPYMYMVGEGMYSIVTSLFTCIVQNTSLVQYKQQEK